MGICRCCATSYVTAVVLMWRLVKHKLCKMPVALTPLFLFLPPRLLHLHLWWEMWGKQAGMCKPRNEWQLTAVSSLRLQRHSVVTRGSIRSRCSYSQHNKCLNGRKTISYFNTEWARWACVLFLLGHQSGSFASNSPYPLPTKWSST